MGVRERVCQLSKNKVVATKSDGHSQASWEQFYDSGLLWWVNRILMTFGWVIVLVFSDDNSEVHDVYPARTKCLGFDAGTDASGLKKFVITNRTDCRDV